VGLVVEKVALGQVFLRVLRFCPVSFIPPTLHDTERRRKLIIFIKGVHNKPQGCGESVASAVGPFTKRKKYEPCMVFCIKSNKYRFYTKWGNLREKDHLKDLGVDGIII
jgi:hypothetical protein